MSTAEEALKTLKNKLINGDVSFDEYSKKRAELLGKNLVISEPKLEGEGRQSTISDDEEKQKTRKRITKPETVSEPKDDRVASLADAPKKRNKKLGIIIGVLLAFILMVVAAIILFDSPPKTEDKKEVTIPTELKYVISSKLNLAENPGESAKTIHELPFGTKVNVILGKDTVIGDYAYREAFYGDTRGWVTIRAKGILLLNDENTINSIFNLFNTEDLQEILGIMTAYSKYALLGLNEKDNFKNFRLVIDQDVEGCSPIAFLRSGIHNRHSSSDKKKGVNNHPKDMIALLNYSDYQEIVVLSFDRNYNWSILYNKMIQGNFVKGFHRVKRRSEIEFFDNFEGLIEERLMFDAAKVFSESGDFYLYAPNGAFQDYYIDEEGLFSNEACGH